MTTALITSKEKLPITSALHITNTLLAVPATRHVAVGGWRAAAPKFVVAPKSNKHHFNSYT